MDEKDSVANFLNEVGSEKSDIFREEPGTTETIEQKEEKPLRFDKDPKVQRYIEKQVEKALKDKPSFARESDEKAPPSDVKDVIGAFTAIIGNDTPEKVKALEALEKTLNGSDERASQKAVERFQREQAEALTKASEADKKAQEELDNYFDEIEETYNVDLSSNSASAKAMRSQFIEYVRKIAPKDANGEVATFPDLVASFEEFQERNKRAPATRAKELASRGMTRSNDTATTMPQGRSWKDVDRFFDKLKAGT